MITVIYSTITGNTEKVAKSIYESLKVEKEIFNINDIAQKNFEKSDIIILCYWCSRGTADSKTLGFLDKVKNKKIIAVGTLGAYVESEHGQKMAERVKEKVMEKNEYIGKFVCRGKIDPKRTEKRLSLPKTDKHFLDEEGYKRHLSSRVHPTQEDLSNAIDVVQNILKDCM
ncbi:MAG: flavodoxin family protein [Lachnospirales bacterium]